MQFMVLSANLSTKRDLLRLCVDYRTLNENTIKDAYPIPRTKITLRLCGSQWTQSKDLDMAYHQLPAVSGLQLHSTVLYLDDIIFNGNP